MRIFRLVSQSALLLAGLSCLVYGNPGAGTSAISAGDSEFFEKSIRPVLAKNCYSCHAGDQQMSALRVDSREALLKGGKRGPSIVPGHPDQSLLMKALRHDGLKMPIGSRLPESEIAAVETWIQRNAPWPIVEGAKVSSRREKYAQLRQEHWAFQPVAKVSPPVLEQSPASRGPIDRFITDRLRKSGLDLATPAEKRILMRRLSYVLTGLPPKPSEIDTFIADASPDAYQKLVDRTLASPHFGEHWARHWLDLVRFGETRGYEWNYEIIGAWRYRDYLIRAFNSDVPYDQLVREHIAGDLLPTPRINKQENLNESLIGTAFYRLGEAGHDDCVRFREIALDVIDNEIDTLTKTFQGMTVSCARCHDHKLDPIPTEDYYGLYSVLNSSRVVTHTIDTAEANHLALQRLKQLKKDVHSELASVWKREAGDVARYMLATRPHSSPAGSLDTQRVEAWKHALVLKESQMEEPSYPWASLGCRTGFQEKFLSGESANLAAKYRRESAEREAYNRKNFQPFGSFGDKVPDGWTAGGNSLENSSGVMGDFAVAASGNKAITNVLPKGFYTNLLSARLNGAVRSPDLPKDRKFVSLRIMGGNLGARRTVIDNCAIGENYKVLENEAPTWVKLETFAKEERLPVFLEMVTRSDNPRLPDRPDVLKANQKKLLTDPRSYFGIIEAVVHDGPDVPKASLSHVTPILNAKVSSWSRLAHAYQFRIEEAVARWSSSITTEEDVQWLSWLVQNNLLSSGVNTTTKLATLISEYRAVENQIPEPRVVEGLADKGLGRDYPVLIGGNAKTFGNPAPRRFLRTILNDKPFETAGSGRKELAEIIASPDNPLTARVMVNRIWQHVFGGGLVRTVDNFGVLGDRPSHPELLDYLANDFVAQGWSIRKAIRAMVLSETFRQSGSASSKSKEIDPENALLSHYPLHRLEAESIRDSILTSAGELSPSMFGFSTDPHRDQPQDYRKLFSGPLDGAGRRSLYLKVTRMEGARFLEIFDYPIPMSARGNRDVTNVPAQALTMLNDPFILLEAERFAAQLLARPADSVDSRMEQLFLSALGRRPTDAEHDRFRGLAAELASLHGIPKEATLNSPVVWKDLAHTVFNMKEFIYVQ